MAVENRSGELLTPTSLGGLGGQSPLPIKARVAAPDLKKTVPTRRLWCCTGKYVGQQKLRN